MIKSATARALVGAALLFTATAAAAAPNWSTGRIAVSTAGLDLTSASGRVAFDRRVDAAIAAMCGAPALGTRDEADALRECRAEARAAATPEMRRVVTRAGMTLASSRP